MTRLTNAAAAFVLILSFSLSAIAPAAAVEGFDNFDSRACYCTEP